MSMHMAPQRGATDRIRSTAVAAVDRLVLVSALVTASVALTSCLFLSPDEQDRTHVRLVIEATADARSAVAGSGASNGLDKAPSCADASDYLQTPGQLAGVARVWRLPESR